MVKEEVRPVYALASQALILNKSTLFGAADLPS